MKQYRFYLNQHTNTIEDWNRKLIYYIEMRCNMEVVEYNLILNVFAMN
jgi:hypothetical protein